MLHIVTHEPNAVQDLAARYEHWPAIRALVQLVPGGASVDAAVLARLNNYRADKLREFFDELRSGKLTLTSELVEDDDFLFCYFATVNAVLRSHRGEKIRYLARLLRARTSGKVDGAREYEELLAITDDLSNRELWLLAALATHEHDNPIQAGENELQRASRFWPSFVASVGEHLGVSEPLLSAMLVRLQRSGCYEEFTGAYLNYTGGRGRLTELYHRLANAAGHISDLSD